MSYYDAVGLLAICDAIETVEAASSNSSASPSPPPSNIATHKAFLAAYSQLTHSHHSHHHSHSRGHHSHTHRKLAMDHHISISAGDLSGLDDSDMPISMSPAIDPAFLDPSITDSERPGRHDPDEKLFAEQYRSPSFSKRKPATHPKPAPSPASSVPPELRSEECHICGRIFRGPKSSTHKQQHIRRLHPDDYQPKRGGKKRALVASASSNSADNDDQSPSDGSSVPSERRVRPKKEAAVLVKNETASANQPSESNPYLE